MAITSNDVITSLNQIIGISPIDNSQVIFLGGDNFCVTVSNFVALFGNASGMNSQALNLIDNGKMGYQNYINDWKNKGYIS